MPSKSFIYLMSTAPPAGSRMGIATSPFIMSLGHNQYRKPRTQRQFPKLPTGSMLTGRLSSEASSSRKSHYETPYHRTPYSPARASAAVRSAAVLSQQQFSLAFRSAYRWRAAFHILFCFLGLRFLNRLFYHWGRHVLRGLGSGLRFSWNCSGNLEGGFC